MKKCSRQDPEKDCNCDTECTTEGTGKSGARDKQLNKQLNCDSYMRARSDYINQNFEQIQELRTSSEHNSIRRRSENRKRRSKRFKES